MAGNRGDDQNLGHVAGLIAGLGLKMQQLAKWFIAHDFFGDGDILPVDFGAGQPKRRGYLRLRQPVECQRR